MIRRLPIPALSALRALCLGLCFSTVSILTQSIAAQTVSTENDPLHRIRFRLYAVNSRGFEGLHYLEKPQSTEPTELRFRAYNRSAWFSYEGSSPLVIFRLVPATDGSLVRQPVASVSLPQTRGDFLFFFVENTANIEQTADAPPPPPAPPQAPGSTPPPLPPPNLPLYDILPMDDSLRAFPMDSVAFLNFTGARLLGIFGEKEITLETGLSPIFSLREIESKDLFVGLVVRYADSYKKVLQNRWNFFPNNRTVVLLLPPERPGSFRIQAYRIGEFISPEQMLEALD